MNRDLLPKTLGAAKKLLAEIQKEKTDLEAKYDGLRAQREEATKLVQEQLDALYNERDALNERINALQNERRAQEQALKTESGTRMNEEIEELRWTAKKRKEDIEQLNDHIMELELKAFSARVDKEGLLLDSEKKVRDYLEGKGAEVREYSMWNNYAEWKTKAVHKNGVTVYQHKGEAGGYNRYWAVLDGVLIGFYKKYITYHAGDWSEPARCAIGSEHNTWETFNDWNKALKEIEAAGTDLRLRDEPPSKCNQCGGGGRKYDGNACYNCSGQGVRSNRKAADAFNRRY